MHKLTLHLRDQTPATKLDLESSPRTGSELLATSQLTIHPLPPKVGKFKWNYIFSGGKFPISTVFCNSLSVPNVSQTCKLVNNTLIGPEGPYKLIFKN